MADNSRHTSLSSAEDHDTDEGTASSSATVKNLVKPVVNAIRILRFLSQVGRPARATQIARELKINTSTCFNILRTLVGEDVVAFDDVAKTYTTGIGMMKLVENTLTEGQRLTLAKPLLEEMAEKFSATMTLWRKLGSDRIVLVAAENSPSDLRIHMTSGQRLPIFMGAAGRLFVAHSSMTKSQAKLAFRSLRWSRPLSFESYWAEVEEARERGWSLDDGYFAPGIQTLSAPVYDPAGTISFAVSAVSFRDQHTKAEIEQLGIALAALGKRLTVALF